MLHVILYSLLSQKSFSNSCYSLEICLPKTSVKAGSSLKASPAQWWSSVCPGCHCCLGSNSHRAEKKSQPFTISVTYLAMLLRFFMDEAQSKQFLPRLWDLHTALFLSPHNSCWSPCRTGLLWRDPTLQQGRSVRSPPLRMKEQQRQGGMYQSEPPFPSPGALGGRRWRIQEWNWARKNGGVRGRCSKIWFISHYPTVVFYLRKNSLCKPWLSKTHFLLKSHRKTAFNVISHRTTVCASRGNVYFKDIVAWKATEMPKLPLSQSEIASHYIWCTFGRSTVKEGQTPQTIICQ